MPAATRRSPRQKPVVPRRSPQQKQSASRPGPQRILEPYGEVIRQWWHDNVICNPNCSRYQKSSEKLRLFLESKYGVKVERTTVWREVRRLGLDKHSPNRTAENRPEAATSASLHCEAPASESDEWEQCHGR